MSKYRINIDLTEEEIKCLINSINGNDSIYLDELLNYLKSLISE